MRLCSGLFGSSLGRKYIMAVTGLGLFIFVILHMLGNLQIFFGPELLNRYAHFLQTSPEILWPARVGLLVLVGLHFWAAVSLALANRAARPRGYSRTRWVAASYASRTMMMSGLIIAVFVIYHLLHFTVQLPEVNLTGTDFKLLQDAEGRHDVFRMMVRGYSNPWVSGFYILGMALLCLHLSHGAGSLFQSIGLKNDFYGPYIDRGARLAAWVIFVGNCSIPVAVLLGYGR